MKSFKKFIAIFACMFIMFNQNISTYASDMEKQYSDSVYIVVNQICNIEQINLKIINVFDLYDVSLMQKYKLIEFEEGYAIVTNDGVISEYNTNIGCENPYKGIDANIVKLIYGGPGNYYIKTYDFVYTNSIIAESKNDKIQNYDECDVSIEVKEISDKLVSKPVS